MAAEEESWTPGDEANLMRLQKEGISVAETALGAEQKRRIGMFIGGVTTASIPKESIQALEAAIDSPKQQDTTVNQSDNNISGPDNDAVVQFRCNALSKHCHVARIQLPWHKLV